MKKGFASILIIFFISPLILFAATQSELEQQIENVRIEREALLQEQKKLLLELEAVNNESRTLGSTVKTLDASRKKLNADINITKSRITSTDLTIKTLENTMSEKEQQIVIHRRALADVLHSLSDHDDSPLIVDILTSASLSDIWEDRGELLGLNSKLREEIAGLRETHKELNVQIEQKEKVKKAQISLQGQLNGQKSVVEESKKAKEKLLSLTKSKEAEYQKLLTENAARRREFEEDLYRLESELNITIDPSLIPSAKPGAISWPFDLTYMDFCKSDKNVKELRNNKCVTQRFTYQPMAVNKGHNGVDFRAAVGTPVKTIYSGIVVGAGNSDDQRNCYSYGRWILIKHDTGLSSVYAHLSASLVTVGQTVNTGDIIGYSGGAFRANGSGNSTAPHLHLGLFASQGVDVRPFTSERYLTTGLGCNQVMVPVADPKAYLNPLDYLPAL